MSFDPWPTQNGVRLSGRLIWFLDADDTSGRCHRRRWLGENVRAARSSWLGRRVLRSTTRSLSSVPQRRLRCVTCATTSSRSVRASTTSIPSRTWSRSGLSPMADQTSSPVRSRILLTETRCSQTAATRFLGQVPPESCRPGTRTSPVQSQPRATFPVARPCTRPSAVDDHAAWPSVHHDETMNAVRSVLVASFVPPR